MVESRCGLLCSECEVLLKGKCGGCLVTGPTWGECEAKRCCESYDLAHCGQCKSFPCVIINDLTYDKLIGDYGKRIEQCRMWQMGL